MFILRNTVDSLYLNTTVLCTHLDDPGELQRLINKKNPYIKLLPFHKKVNHDNQIKENEQNNQFLFKEIQEKIMQNHVT